MLELILIDSNGKEYNLGEVDVSIDFNLTSIRDVPNLSSRAILQDSETKVQSYLSMTWSRASIKKGQLVSFDGHVEGFIK